MHLHVIRIKWMIDTLNNCLAHRQKYLLKHGHHTILVLCNKLINQRYEVLQVSRLINIFNNFSSQDHLILCLPCNLST